MLFVVEDVAGTTCRLFNGLYPPTILIIDKIAAYVVVLVPTIDGLKTKYLLVPSIFVAVKFILLKVPFVVSELTPLKSIGSPQDALPNFKSL